MTEWWQVAVAIYAAIVGTGALALEIRRWFEGKPRLFVNVTPGMSAINVPGTEGNSYLTVRVTNRGASPTTLQLLALFEYPTWWHRFRRKAGRRGVAANPTLPGIDTGKLPHVLEPGNEWTGMILEDEELRKWVQDGNVYVGVYASHSERPTLMLVKPEPDKSESLKDAEQH